MIDAQTLRLIQEEIKRQMNVILVGQAGEASEKAESIDNMFPGMPTIADQPIMHPCGLSSAAPRGIPSMVGRAGEHKGNRFVMGHRDPARPACKPGETVL